MSENTTTTAELCQTAGEWAQVFKVTESAFNVWKRKAQNSTGKQFGTKEGQKRYFSQSEVQIILKYRGEDPESAYKPEDQESAKSSASSALTMRSSAIISEVEEVLQMAADQDRQIIKTAARYLAPSSRKARIMKGIALEIEAIEEESLVIALEDSFSGRILPPQAFI